MIDEKDNGNGDNERRVIEGKGAGMSVLDWT